MGLVKMNGNFFVWTKGERLKLGSDFTTHEFDCHCLHAECKEQVIHRDLITDLERVRGHLGQPIKVTSGFRCTRHQIDLKAMGFETAKGTSSHELGMAADITCEDVPALVSACEKEFRAIGVARRFVHVDLRRDKPRRWGYTR
jgi:zinc D-Ala-D-Ala carboxypeptidase